MGCGQSRMGGMVYPRKGWKGKNDKRKANKTEKHGDDCELDDDLLNENNAQEQNSHHGAYTSSANWNQDGNLERKRNTNSSAGRGHRPVTVSGPILAQMELSASQMEFFRMLDEKIASGKDYDSSEENEEVIEETRKCQNQNQILQYHQPFISHQHMHHRIAVDECDRREHRILAEQSMATVVDGNSGVFGTQIEPKLQSHLSSWPNVQSLTNYECEEQVSRTSRSQRISEGDGNGRVKATSSAVTKKEGRSKSWFSETYSAWPLRRIGAALRDDRTTGNRRSNGGRDSQSKKKGII